MSLRMDRAASQAYRYAQHRMAVESFDDKLSSTLTFLAFIKQFPNPEMNRLSDIYHKTLKGELDFEDRRKWK